MNKNKSFTLIELLVVIVIIGILAGVIMISTSSSIDKANIAKSKVFEESVQNNLAANMVSKWSFDGSTVEGNTVVGSDIIDAWSTNNCEAIGGAPKMANYNECISGKCIKFNGSTGDYIQIPHNSNLQSQSITITAWVKLNSDGTRHIITNKWNGWALEVSSSGNPYFQVYTSAGTKNAQSADGIRWGQYYFLVGVFDKNKISYSGSDIKEMPTKIYVDGFLKNGTNTGNTLIAYNDQRVRISDPQYDGGEVNGFIDEMKIYDAVLPTSQIKQNYIAGLNSMLSNGNISNKEYNERINELAYDK